MEQIALGQLQLKDKTKTQSKKLQQSLWMAQ